MNVVARYRMDPHFFRDAPHAVDEQQVTFLVRRDKRLTLGAHEIAYAGQSIPCAEITSLTWDTALSLTNTGDLAQREFGFVASSPTSRLAVSWQANDTLEGFFRAMFQRTTGEQPLSARRIEEQHLAFEVVVAALRKFVLPGWMLRQKARFADGKSLKIGPCLLDAFGAHFSLDTASGSLPVSLLWSEMRVKTEGAHTCVAAVYDDQVAVRFPTSRTSNACLLGDLWMEQVMAANAV